MRRHGIDEVPQLLNIVFGQMSLVGPRPLDLADHAELRRTEHRRYGLKPGLTGPWQVTSRDEIDLREMSKLDVVYARDWSVPLDIDILVRTLLVMARGYRHPKRGNDRPDGLSAAGRRDDAERPRRGPRRPERRRARVDQDGE
jgi:lipopolysaccharide/colanic/teichoic acid biosynthesis glycosyltransferase